MLYEYNDQISSSSNVCYQELLTIVYINQTWKCPWIESYSTVCFGAQKLWSLRNIHIYIKRYTTPWNENLWYIKCALEKFGLLGGFYRLLLNLIDLVNRMVKVEKRELFSQLNRFSSHATSCSIRWVYIWLETDYSIYKYLKSLNFIILMRPLSISPYSDFMLTVYKKSIHMYYDSILTMFLREWLENVDEMKWAYITMPHQHWP